MLKALHIEMQLDVEESTPANIIPVDAGLFFKSFFYIAVVYWENMEFM